MNAANWIALAAMVVSILTMIFGGLTRYAFAQRSSLVDEKFKHIEEKVSSVDGNHTKLMDKLEAILTAQQSIRGDVGELRSQLTAIRGSKAETDASVNEIWKEVVTKEVFDLRMTRLERDIATLSLRVESIPCRGMPQCIKEPHA